MKLQRIWAKSPHLISSFGALLLLIALVHHTGELLALNTVIGPLIAGLLDSVLALGLVYAGYRLTGTDLAPKDLWRVLIWCLLGAGLFVAIMGLSLVIRAFEGRVIGEAIFPLLLSAEAGGLAGVTAGYYVGRARTEYRRAQTVSEAFELVNSLIRHDLRNDLSVIQGHAQLLETNDESGATERTSDSRSIIGEKAEEALTRIDTTGEVAKTLSGDAKLEPTDLAGITTEIANRVENTYDVTVTTSIPSQATVSANKGLRSVIDNLLENAVEHNDTDDPQVHVNVTVNRNTVTLTVADNGPGLSDVQKERVLTAQRKEKKGGGLSLVQTLVEGYNGVLRIKDNDPRGAVFTVELPRTETDPS